MSDAIITPEELAAALTECCMAYSDEIKEKVADGLEKIGSETLSEVKETAPISDGGDRSIPYGVYRRNFVCQTDKERGEITTTVYQKGKHYRLTHLLENGHLNRDGTTRSKEFPHISIANEHAQKKADKLLEDL